MCKVPEGPSKRKISLYPFDEGQIQNIGQTLIIGFGFSEHRLDGRLKEYCRLKLVNAVRNEKFMYECTDMYVRTIGVLGSLWDVRRICYAAAPLVVQFVNISQNDIFPPVADNLTINVHLCNYVDD